MPIDRYMPRSLLWFALIFPAGLIVLIPMAGGVLFDRYVFGLMINLGFASLAFEALTGRTSRYWLILPVLWFGGYTAFRLASNSEIARIDREFRLANSGVSILFHKDREVLVMKYGSGAGELLKEYDLSLAYEQNGSDPTPRAFRIAEKQLCEQMTSDANLRALDLSIRYVSEARRGPSSAARWCVYSMPENPKLPWIEATIRNTRFKDTFLVWLKTSATITGAGTTQTVEVGTAETFPWYPHVALSCFSRRSSPCRFLFWPSGGVVGLGVDDSQSTAYLQPMAKALGLSSAPPFEKRRASGDAEVAEQIELRRKEGVADALARLDAVLADPNKSIGEDEFRVLRAEPEHIIDRATKITDTAIVVLEDTKRVYETGRAATSMQNLVAAMPGPTFAKEGKRLIERLMATTADQRATAISWNWSSAFLEKAGELGPAALPFLKWVAFDAGHKFDDASAILGLCRMGRPAAPTADQLAAELDSAKFIERRAAAKLALLRMGRADLASRGFNLTNERVRDKFETLKRTFAPESDPSVCSSRSY